MQNTYHFPLLTANKTHLAKQRKGGTIRVLNKTTERRDIMTLRLNAYSPIANKLLVLLSGFSRNQRDKNGKKVYEKYQYNLEERFTSLRFPHSLMKQILTYICLSDSKGEIAYTKEDDLAEFMGCSVRTVQHNNQLLFENDIISWERIYTGAITVSFNHYLEDIMDLTEVGSVNDGEEVAGFEGKRFAKNHGYTLLSKDLLTELIQLDDVNALRLALRALRNLEKDINVQKQEDSYLSYAELKEVLPEYIGYKSAIRNLLEKVRGLFDLHIFDTRDKVDELVDRKGPVKEIVQKAKSAFLVSVGFGKESNARQNQQQEQLVAQQRISLFRREVQDSTFYVEGKTGNIRLPEIVALISSFGLKTIEKVLSIVKDEFDSALNRTDIINQFNENSSKFIREYALALKI